MKAWAIFVLSSLVACDRGVGGDDGPAPAASNIPRAAPNATGAIYPPPTAYPPGLSPPGPLTIPPPPGIHDPFGTPPSPPSVFGAGGGGTHL